MSITPLRLVKIKEDDLKEANTFQDLIKCIIQFAVHNDLRLRRYEQYWLKPSDLAIVNARMEIIEPNNDPYKHGDVRYEKKNKQGNLEGSIWLEQGPKQYSNHTWEYSMQTKSVILHKYFHAHPF